MCVRITCELGSFVEKPCNSVSYRRADIPNAGWMEGTLRRLIMLPLGEMLRYSRFSATTPYAKPFVHHDPAAGI